MIVYLEGPDGSGKSTLAKTVSWNCSNLSIDYVFAEPSIQTNPTKPNRIFREELILRLYHMLTNKKTVYILDRGPISDCIYRLFDKYDPVIELNELVDLLSRYSENIFLVYCNNDKAEEYMLERGDDNPVAIKKHKKISMAYDMIMPLLENRVTYMKYDFTKDPTKQAHKIRNWLQDKFERKRD